MNRSTTHVLCLIMASCFLLASTPFGTTAFASESTQDSSPNEMDFELISDSGDLDTLIAPPQFIDSQPVIESVDIPIAWEMAATANVKVRDSGEITGYAVTAIEQEPVDWQSENTFELTEPGQYLAWARNSLDSVSEPYLFSLYNVTSIDVDVPANLSFTIDAQRDLHCTKGAEITSRTAAPMNVYCQTVLANEGAPKLVADNAFPDWNSLCAEETAKNIAISLNGSNISTPDVLLGKLDSASLESTSLPLDMSVQYGKVWLTEEKLQFSYVMTLRFEPVVSPEIT